MSSYIHENRHSLQEYHYIRKATNNYWFDLTDNVLQNYIDQYGSNFCVVIYGSEDEDDAYIVPYAVITPLLNEELLDNRKRWGGRISNHSIRINNGDSIQVSDYFNAFDYLQSEEALFFEDDYEQQPPQDIIAYNELRSCADLYRMYKRGILDIQPDFQREEVWPVSARTRFIDSLIKQLPIPSMCFSLDFKTQKWQVIDGLQRMSSIIKFLSTDKKNVWRLSKLTDVDPRIAGKKIEEFHDEGSNLYSLFERVENLTLPITVIRCDYSKKSHTDYLFTIFHRLNTGGTRLNNQEIRNCIYNGTFNSLLKDLNSSNNKWRDINRMKSDKSYRFTRVELILRFFAYQDNYEKYEGRLAKFLNTYMAANRNPKNTFLREKKEIFNRTIDILYSILEEPFPKISNSILEAILFGIANNLAHLEERTMDQRQLLYNQLLQHNALAPETLQRDVTGKDKVLARLSAAKTVFSE